MNTDLHVKRVTSRHAEHRQLLEPAPGKLVEAMDDDLLVGVMTTQTKSTLWGTSDSIPPLKLGSLLLVIVDKRVSTRRRCIA